MINIFNNLIIYFYIKILNLDLLIIEGKDIFPNSIFSNRKKSIIYDNGNTYIKTNDNTNNTSLNINGDYSCQSTIILEGIIINTLNKLNSPHFPKFYNLFMSENQVYLEIEKSILKIYLRIKKSSGFPNII